ncbi:MAG: hypothetical protein RMA76_15850 [Deltaproteobacteria bacterium]
MLNLFFMLCSRSLFATLLRGELLFPHALLLPPFQPFCVFRKASHVKAESGHAVVELSVLMDGARVVGLPAPVRLSDESLRSAKAAVLTFIVDVTIVETMAGARW